MEKYNYIRATVRKAAVRLTALDMIKCAGVGLIFGLVMALVVSVVGIFYPVMFVKQYGYLACVLGAVSGAVYAIFKRTKMGEAATGLSVILNTASGLSPGFSHFIWKPVSVTRMMNSM